MPAVRSVAGMRDLLPDQLPTWIDVISKGEELARLRGYRRIETPVVEHTELFEHAVGAGTDIVDKEMYTFDDKGGRSLTLRPEATAAVVRAYFEAGLHQAPQPVRLVYVGPMFRYDRPQKGRYRSFRQYGVEAIGDASAQVDVEVVALARDWLNACELARATLQLNSIGDSVCRPAYKQALRDYYAPHLDELCEDCRRRYEINPMRLFDCKKPGCQPFMAKAPLPVDHLCEPCSAHYAEVKQGLTGLSVEFAENPRLVRGLDYYTRTAFEFWDPEHGGAQNAFGGGGRYDDLAELLGFSSAPAVGFAMGIDRVVDAVLDDGRGIAPPTPEVYVIAVEAGGLRLTQPLARDLRAAGVETVVATGERSLKAHMRQAQKLGARYAVILGRDEVARGDAVVRDMGAQSQTTVKLAEVPESIAGVLGR